MNSNNLSPVTYTYIYSYVVCNGLLSSSARRVREVFRLPALCEPRSRVMAVTSINSSNAPSNRASPPPKIVDNLYECSVPIGGYLFARSLRKRIEFESHVSSRHVLIDLFNDGERIYRFSQEVREKWFRIRFFNKDNLSRIDLCGLLRLLPANLFNCRCIGIYSVYQNCEFKACIYLYTGYSWIIPSINST